MELAFVATDAVAAVSLIAAKNQLVALNFDVLAELGDNGRERLRKWAEGGATIYIRGGLRDGRLYSLEPFSSQQFEFSSNAVGAYQCSAHWVLPAAIAGERVAAMLNMPQAIGLNSSIQPLLLSRDEHGAELPAIFAVEIGSGLVVFDLHHDDATSEPSLLEELVEPSTRPGCIGALAVVDWAAGRNPLEDSPINLVIDDRPVNYDYFSIGRMKAFLDHLGTRYPGIHVDFAWTPNDTHPNRRLVDLLRRSNAGFVWHGFLRHVDHRNITDYSNELHAGRTLVEAISREYNVRFQPVMIFPFEKSTPQADELLRRSKFVAKVQCYDNGRAIPWCSRLRSLQNETGSNASLPVIFRHSIDQLSRDRMLALAVLGMPISALAHPRDLGLRRLGRQNLSAVSYFDFVLKFAKEKSLTSMSLEEIAAKVALE
jgi:hypothetical protein